MRDSVQINKVSKLCYLISYIVNYSSFRPLLFSLHPTSLTSLQLEITADIDALVTQQQMSGNPSGNPRVTQGTPSGEFPCLGHRYITAGSPGGVPAHQWQSPDHHADAFQFYVKFLKISRRPAILHAAFCQTPAGHPQISKKMDGDLPIAGGILNLS